MMEGKVRAALHLLSQEEGGSPVALDETIEVNGKILMVRDILNLKHPEGKPIVSSEILDTSPPCGEPHTAIFEEDHRHTGSISCIGNLGCSWPGHSRLMCTGGDVFAHPFSKFLPDCVTPWLPCVSGSVPTMLTQMV